jgi:hypothetical membrane protein
MESAARALKMPQPLLAGVSVLGRSGWVLSPGCGRYPRGAKLCGSDKEAGMSVFPHARDRARHIRRRRQAPNHLPGPQPRGNVGGDIRSLRLSGTLALCAGVAILMGIITAEALFTGAPYNTSHNMISDLGSTWNPGGRVYEPSATIFNVTMLVTGVMIAASAGFLHRASDRRGVSAALGVLGLGIFLVGIFPGEMINGSFSSHGVHPIVSMVAFVSGPIAALLSARLTKGPFRFVAVILGATGLVAILLTGPLGDTHLGKGGIERWIAYPTILWLVAFGGYLLAARPDELRRPDPETTPDEV